jgi:hypothetical protein
MQTSTTFSILFWPSTAKIKNGLAPLYARITVNGKRAELSLKRSISICNWDDRAKQSTLRTSEGKALNIYLDQVYFNLLECQKQLLGESVHLTAKAIKARYLRDDIQNKTLLELVSYHNQTMTSVLKSGTLKNYHTTEKYIKKYLVTELKVGDIYLKQLSYKFILNFEYYLRTGKSINKY